MLRGRRNRILGSPASVLLFVTVALALFAVVMAADGGDAAPNLYVEADDIVPLAPQPTKGTQTTVDVTVHNGGDSNATGFYVKLRDVTAAKDLGKLGPYNVTANSSLDMTFSWDLTGAAGGKHTLRATVDVDGDVTESDETDNSADKDVTVNLPPVAGASASHGFAYTGMDITFVASGSSDPDGTITNYLWTFGDGYTDEGYNVTHSYADGSPSPGKDYNVTLVVSDEDGGVGTKTITVRIYNRLPYAVASDKTINTMTTTSVDGSGSYDVDGKVVTYRWTLHNVTVLWGSTVAVNYPDDGRYRMTLTVWDDDGESDTTSIYITVLNQAPWVDLSVNRTLVSTGDSIRFDASGSQDVDGSITNYTWIFGDRTFAFTAVTDHSYSVNGSFNVTLVVVDDDGAIAYATVRIIVGNTAPFAVARANTAYALTYEDVEFNASSSSDVDDNIASYAWDFGDGFSATDKVVVHNFTDDGIYDVTLTVTDTAGVFGISTISIVIENRAPVAIFEDLVVTTHEPAWFNGSMCWDMDGYIASYLWDLGDGLIYTTANASHTWDGPGKFLIILKIWDDDGATNVTEFNVTVLNQSPIASMTASPLKTTLAHPVVFNGSASRDPDGTIVNWTWSFGDGARGYGELVMHIYTAYGTYLVSLTIRDDSGGINSTTVTITVRNQPPLAVMNVTPLIAFTGEVITFDGRNSSDPENQIAEYFWSFGDGTSATGPLVTHTYADDSWYTVRLTVADQDATTSFMEVVVKITNRAPTAKAEASLTSAKTLEDMAFKGTMSHDEDGRVLWYHWDFGDGTVGYGENVVHVFADDGIYTVTLTVTDDDGTEGTDTVEVTVINRAPTSVAGNDQSTRTGIPIRLDGRQSYDLDGTITEYHWDFGDETTATGPVVTHAFPSYGSFMVVLTVTDDDGATSVANLTVRVDNVQPVARFTGNTRILSGNALELDGTSSYDLDGTIAEHRWTMGDGGTKFGPIIEYTYTEVGTYTVTLTVKDDGGLMSSYTMDIEVLNRRPSASISASKSVLPTGTTLDLDGSNSDDSDGKVETYTWIFGDGSVAYGARVTHIYDDDGIYMVVLTVTDDRGGTDSTSVFIQVENRPPYPAIDGPDQALTLTVVDFTAEGTIDPDGTISGYFWDFGDGDGANGWNTSHEYSTSGTYTIRLTVLDDDGKTSYTNVTIEVINRPPMAEADVPDEAVENTTVKFDATACYDLDGLINEWNWDFGDETTGEGREAYNRYREPGTYTWTLIVVDDTGDEQEISGSIYIKDKPKVPVGPDDNGDDGNTDESPGPGALVALITLALVGIGLAYRRRGQQD